MAEAELRNQLEALRQENAYLAALKSQQNTMASVSHVTVKSPISWAESPSL